ncbi:hypothetical protein J056_004420 [Wallemia ichthyophaga EXF-994]|uniref:Uncharacterized protein n=1 Tax=Wallemia ichthyophaga (strain EXF-994 / CBS 113033) TaxID=1299270 RepID=R9AFV2_WALI9|nr:uncharacterized protein J056_004420 [Wallemia ichthyophaga EXF-994]EOR01099.1 hypothetical protein J056_004420 [Wallemia ichthyophaga EXF-994]
MGSIADHYAAKPKVSPKKPDEGFTQKEAKARSSVAEPSQPNKRIKGTVPLNEKERRDDIKRRLEVSRQKRRLSMTANTRGRPLGRIIGGGKPPTRVATASKAAWMIKSVGKKIFGGGSSSTTNAKELSSSGGGEEGIVKTRIVKKHKKVHRGTVEAQQRAAGRVKMAKLKDTNEGGKGMPAKRGVRGSNVNKRPSQAEQVSKARMSHSPVKRRGTV